MSFHKILPDKNKIAVLYAETAGSNFSELYANLIEDAVYEDPDIGKTNLIKECIDKIIIDYLANITENDLLRKIPGLEFHFNQKKSDTGHDREIWKLFLEIRNN